MTVPVRHVYYTDLVLELLARVPAGLTSAQISRELGITSDGASRFAQRLYTTGRIDRELCRARTGRPPQFSIWKAKDHG